MGAKTGDKNPFRKGGRTISSHGYMLVRVGASHHLACVNGYAYEHRLIAEQKLSRRLNAGEVVHHINGVKIDNRPENIEVTSSIASHLFKHRKIITNRRTPGESNSEINCACGCGTRFEKFDSKGRPRKYISGHNPSSAPTLNAIIGAISNGLSSTDEISESLGLSYGSVNTGLFRLHRRGLISRIGHGQYGPVGSAPIKVQGITECACGCGSKFQKYDNNGRPRRYVSGHNINPKGANS